MHLVRYIAPRQSSLLTGFDQTRQKGVIGDLLGAALVFLDFRVSAALAPFTLPSMRVRCLFPNKGQNETNYNNLREGAVNSDD